MSQDRIIDSVKTAVLELPVGPKRLQLARARVRNLALFFERNALFQGNTLKSGHSPSETNEIWWSDLNDDGHRLIDEAFLQWLRAVDRSKRYDDFRVLERSLKKIKRERLNDAGKRLRRDDNIDAPPRKEVKIPRGPRKDPLVFDKAKWHLEGEFPKGLPAEQAYVHTGLFIEWLFRKKMLGNNVEASSKRDGQGLTGIDLYKSWDGCFASDVLKPEALSFVKAYYGRLFFLDYEDAFGKEYPSLYHVKGTLKNLKRMEGLWNDRFTHFVEQSSLRNSSKTKLKR